MAPYPSLPPAVLARLPDMGRLGSATCRTHEGRVLWLPAARRNALAAMASQELDKVFKDGRVMCSTDAYLTHYVILTAPFAVVSLGPIWDLDTGYDKSVQAPRVHLFERDVLIGECRAYQNLKEERGLPRYGLRRPHVPPERHLESLLPGQVKLDVSWLVQAKKAA